MSTPITENHETQSAYSSPNAYEWCYAYGQPAARAQLKKMPADFQVDEQLGFDLDGEGDHVFIRIQKTGLNTQAIAKHIAHLIGVRERDVGYAGMKDRHAITTQWFSADMAGRAEPDWQHLNTDQIRVVDVVRHRRKLRRGALKGNCFKIRLREITGDQDEVLARLDTIAAQGVPNYYGEQRFGRNNVAMAEAMFSRRLRVKRHQRSIYLSAARSWLFNSVLSRRVESGHWNTALVGDVMQLAGTNSVFKITSLDDEIIGRVKSFDIHPTGVLWGKGSLMSGDQTAASEAECAESNSVLCQGLEAAGLKQERRSLRLCVADLTWELEADDLILSFFLPAGSYATTVLREIICYQDAH